MSVMLLLMVTPVSVVSLPKSPVFLLCNHGLGVLTALSLLGPSKDVVEVTNCVRTKVENCKIVSCVQGGTKMSMLTLAAVRHLHDCVVFQ